MPAVRRSAATCGYLIRQAHRDGYHLSSLHDITPPHSVVDAAHWAEDAADLAQVFRVDAGRRYPAGRDPRPGSDPSDSMVVRG